MSDHVHVTTAEGPMPAYLWLPESGSGPGVLLVQEIFGVSDYLRVRAAELAEAGYVVLAPELYWRLATSTVDMSDPEALSQAMGLSSQLDWETTVSDAAAALSHLRSLDQVSGGTGVLGFCFGGGVAFHLAALEQPDALVSYYGSSIPARIDLAEQVTCPSLHHYGLSDSYIDAETVAAIGERLTAAGARFETYTDADHAFDNSEMPLHHPEASELAWSRTLAFLGDRLPRG